MKIIVNLIFFLVFTFGISVQATELCRCVVESAPGTSFNVNTYSVEKGSLVLKRLSVDNNTDEEKVLAKKILIENLRCEFRDYKSSTLASCRTDDYSYTVESLVTEAKNYTAMKGYDPKNAFYKKSLLVSTPEFGHTKLRCSWSYLDSCHND